MNFWMMGGTFLLGFICHRMLYLAMVAHGLRKGQRLKWAASVTITIIMAIAAAVMIWLGLHG